MRRAPQSRPVLHVAEPPSAYAARPPLVVDATVFAALVFFETEHIVARATVQARALHAPHLIDYELANVALKKMKRERRTVKSAVDALDAFKSFVVTRHEIRSNEVLALATEYGLTAYDASYLWLAGELGTPLATFDAKLAAAALKYLGDPDQPTSDA